eukprot:1635584-Prymnesium_polylepis.1
MEDGDKQHVCTLLYVSKTNPQKQIGKNTCFFNVACAQNLPPAARHARESAPDARRTSAPGRGAVPRDMYCEFGVHGPVFTVPPRGTLTRTV